MPRLTAAQIARADARLAGEERLPLHAAAGRPIALAGEVYHPTTAVLLRWANLGKRGAHLDVTWAPELLTWVTSRAALERFARAVGAAPAPTAPDASIE